jgi:hypothetical protein
MKQESSADPSYSLSIKQSAISYGEASIALQIFGNSSVLSVTNIDSFFGLEQIPAGWTAPTKAYTETQAGLDVAYLKAKTLEWGCQP